MTRTVAQLERKVIELAQLVRSLLKPNSRARIISSTASIDCRVFLTPGGGIPARSGATLGSATCTHYTVTSGTRASAATSHTVYNDFTSAVAGSTDIVAIKVNGIWLAIAEDC